MADDEIDLVPSHGDDHKAVYIFNGLDDSPQKTRPAKRRKVAGKAGKARDPVAPKFRFTPLFNGAEGADCVRLRQELYESAWSDTDRHIQQVLRDSNQSTLEEVQSFVQGATTDSEKIPAAFIITGPNAASEELLFEQLSENLNDAAAALCVRIRSSEAPNLKVILKKIIRDATTDVPDDDGQGDREVAVGRDGRKYLDYDLEALHVFVKTRPSSQVVVAFQDSEAFDSSLLSDLITLVSAWRDRIQFTLLFGVATSVELFQARLPKATARHLYGRQFDVAQRGAVLESIFKKAIGATGMILRIGPTLLRSFVERQQENVAGVQAFVGSLKYAYMCHFYANPLSVLLLDQTNLAEGTLQPGHLEAIRSLPSFRSHVEAAVEARQLGHAQSLLEDDEYLIKQIVREDSRRRENHLQTLRSLHLILSSGLSSQNFTDLYMDALANGVDISSEDSLFVAAVRRMLPDELVALGRRLLAAISLGDGELSLSGWESEAEDFVVALLNVVGEVAVLQRRATSTGHVLRSAYSAQSRVLRTTVVAQKVQLSRDTAALTAEDKAFTDLVDLLVEQLRANVRCEITASSFLNEVWLYDSKSPHKEVFVPRPGNTYERALLRPYDYLACKCCADANGTAAPTLPAVSIVYHLYLETGAYVNVADLWSAFSGLVLRRRGGQEEEQEDEGCDERAALVQFYRALAELKAMGFVKQSRKKADHVAKLKWL